MIRVCINIIFKKRILGSFILLFTIINVSAQSEIPNVKQLKKNVGDIIYNPKTDRHNFYLCYPDFIPQYYQVNTTYVGGSKGLKLHFLKNWPYNPEFKSINGFITIRFIVNCKGKTDRFRISQLTTTYQKANFDKHLISKLLSLYKSAQQWVPGKMSEGQVVDSYYHLTFKIKGGNIMEIMP